MVLSILIFSTGCGTDNIKSNSKLSGITEAYFSIGGMRGGYRVEIKGKKLTYTVYNHRGGGSSKETIFTLTKNDLEQLEEKFIYVKATEWNKVYKNPPGMMDGTNWIIKYKSNTLNVNSKGKNNYPKSFHVIKAYISSILLKGKAFI
jgi:hypothetical protein